MSKSVFDHCQQGNELEVREILAAHKTSVNARDPQNSTPLHVAATYGHSATVQLLLEAGADKHAKNNMNGTPFHLAAGNGYAITVQLLLQAGADQNAKNIDGMTGLDIARVRGHTSVVKLLESVEGFQSSDEAIVSRISSVPSVADKDDKAAKTIDEMAALDLAHANNYTEVVRLLEPEREDIFNLCRKSNDQVVKECIEVDKTVVHARNDDYDTPLHVAATYGNVATVQLLLRAGADMDAKDANKMTPLHVAAFYGHVDIVQLLLQSGADKDAKAVCDDTPLHYTARNGHTATAQLLLLAGVDQGTKNVYGKTALDVAQERGHTGLVKLLESVHGSQHSDPIISETHALYEDAGASEALGISSSPSKVIEANTSMCESMANAGAETVNQKTTSLAQTESQAQPSTGESSAAKLTNDMQSMPPTTLKSQVTESAGSSAPALAVTNSSKVPDNKMSAISTITESSVGAESTKKSVIHSGWARKKSRNGWFKRWTTRLFVLNGEKISYFSDVHMQNLKGEFFLDSSTTASVEDEKKHRFIIKSTSSGSMLVETETTADMQQWLTAIQTTVRKYHF